ncbi:hypothetical protein F503_07880 [Ophiostoma piceae UAMH 11346]|uniref:Uncharacterized protein n=1 Tax=Ophiostoma piceae (strain UAMH 11346) TaxID=1262450 RepID=S3C145_OPHP1|nr:hypothetical protein F503_07880 [Ophiostoma piceae UAMH 11346]
MPDLNSVPPSPRVLAASRHPSSSGTSPAVLPAIPSISGPAAQILSPTHQAQASPPTQMAPPPIPASPSSIHVFPSNQGLHSSSSLPSPFGPPPVTSTTAENVSGPGPLRHPRPLTAAELHTQLEKEQEAVVNRLTRELTLLRAQNASVVSNTSSTSAGASETQSTSILSSSAPGNGAADHLFSGTTGFSIPSSTGRHNRTYSNASTRSLTSGGGGGGSVSLGAGAANTPSIVGITAPAPIRPTAPNLSRQNSTASRRSRANSPGPIPIPGSGRDRDISSPAILTGTARYEDTAFYRVELENARRENEALRRRIRELERQAAAQTQAAHSAAQQAQAQATSRSRSTSVSTTASVNAVSGASVTGSSLHGTPSATPAGGANITGRRDGGGRVTSMLSVSGSVGVGVPEDEVRVGESAASAGLARGQERSSIDRERP